MSTTDFAKFVLNFALKTEIHAEFLSNQLRLLSDDDFEQVGGKDYARLLATISKDAGRLSKMILMRGSALSEEDRVKLLDTSLLDKILEGKLGK